MACIYTITNKITGSVYVGSTVQVVSRRWKRHKEQLRRNTHDNSHLQRSYNKYGLTSFIWDVIDDDVSVDVLYDRESFWIIFFRILLGKDNVYNQTLAGKNQNIGRVYTKEYREAMSKRVKQEFINNPDRVRVLTTAGNSKVSRQKASASLKAYNQTEQGKIMRAKCLQAALSPQARDKMSMTKSKTYDVTLISPDGEVYKTVRGVARFCRDHNIRDRRTFNDLLLGRQKSSQGWKLGGG